MPNEKSANPMHMPALPLIYCSLIAIICTSSRVVEFLITIEGLATSCIVDGFDILDLQRCHLVNLVEPIRVQFLLNQPIIGKDDQIPLHHAQEFFCIG